MSLAYVAAHLDFDFGLAFLGVVDLALGQHHVLRGEHVAVVGLEHALARRAFELEAETLLD